MNNIPNVKLFAELPHSFAIHLTGADAAKVVNNLSTNDISKLATDATCETMLTDARGWVVAHAGVIKRQAEAWLLGSHPEPSQIANHLDRYIIREAAIVNDRSAELALYTLHENSHHNISVPDGDQTPSSLGTDSSAAEPTSAVAQPLAAQLELAKLSSSAFTCPLPIWGPGTQLLCCPRAQAGEVIDNLRQHGFVQCDQNQFEWLRVTHFWPQQPADIGGKTIPQELDRDQQAISFTKGCYLGQETIARLDARGQLQKKLCLVELAPAGQYVVGDALHNAEKEVGKITSLACNPTHSQIRALAYVRRGNFDVGTELSCNGFSASVLR